MPSQHALDLKRQLGELKYSYPDTYKIFGDLGDNPKIDREKLETYFTNLNILHYPPGQDEKLSFLNNVCQWGSLVGDMTKEAIQSHNVLLAKEPFNFMLELLLGISERQRLADDERVRILFDAGNK